MEQLSYVFWAFIFDPHPNLPHVGRGHWYQVFLDVFTSKNTCKPGPPFLGRGRKGGLGSAKSYCIVYRTRLSGEQNIYGYLNVWSKGISRPICFRSFSSAILINEFHPPIMRIY
jgi:hypothetical protein